jgi:hypothetical protein
MMCCGRSRIGTQLGLANRASSASVPAAPGELQQPTFEYVGKTALTVIGAISGVRYRFDRPGARIRVDRRDQVSLDRVPVLRRVG